MSAFSAAARSREAELMDDDATDYDTFRACLADLARVNRLSLGYRPTIAFLDRLRRAGRLPESRPITILDAGSGYGDTLREIWRWSERAHVDVRLVGVDRNPWSERSAREATPADAPIEYATADIFEYGPPGPVDVVISALFTHHLDDESLVRFVAWMEHVGRLGWFVNDLRRSHLAFTGFRAAAAALRMHRFVRHDGPVSFARAFVEEDWTRTLRWGGLAPGDAEIARVAPFRLCVSRMKP